MVSDKRAQFGSLSLDVVRHAITCSDKLLGTINIRTLKGSLTRDLRCINLLADKEGMDGTAASES